MHAECTTISVPLISIPHRGRYYPVPWGGGGCVDCYVQDPSLAELEQHTKEAYEVPSGLPAYPICPPNHNAPLTVCLSSLYALPASSLTAPLLPLQLPACLSNCMFASLSLCLLLNCPSVFATAQLPDCVYDSC